MNDAAPRAKGCLGPMWVVARWGFSLAFAAAGVFAVGVIAWIGYHLQFVEIPLAARAIFLSMLVTHGLFVVALELQVWMYCHPAWWAEASRDRLAPRLGRFMMWCWVVGMVAMFTGVAVVVVLRPRP